MSDPPPKSPDDDDDDDSVAAAPDQQAESVGSHRSGAGSASTVTGRMAQRIVDHVLEPIDVLGRAIIGDLWEPLYETVQDAIGLSLLVRVPSLILGRQFSAYGACQAEDITGNDYYACMVIVSAGLLGWILIAGRLLARFWQAARRTKALFREEPSRKK